MNHSRGAAAAVTFHWGPIIVTSQVLCFSHRLLLSPGLKSTSLHFNVLGLTVCYSINIIWDVDVSALKFTTKSMRQLGVLSTKNMVLFSWFIGRKSNVFVRWPGQLCCVNWCQDTSAIHQLARRLSPQTGPRVSQTTQPKITPQASFLSNISGWRRPEEVTHWLDRKKVSQPLFGMSADWRWTIEQKW